MAMDRSSADSYVYAKASAILARSFVGSRAQKLYDQTSLKDLWSLLFADPMPEVPQMLLAKEIEYRAEQNFITSYISLLLNYNNPEDVCVSLLHYYDYENIKEIAAALTLGLSNEPDLVDIRPFNIIDYEKWPDIKSVTKDSLLSWYDKVPLPQNQQENDYKLDCQYIYEVFNSIQKVQEPAKKELLSLFTEKFSMENIIWALRLKIYYKYPPEIIAQELAYSTKEKNKNDILVKDALKILEWDTDDYSVWSKWKYAGYLNSVGEGSLWQCDPAWISQKFREHYVHEAYSLFHKLPFTVCPLVSWFILKREELDNIRTATESLRLNIKM